MVLRQCIYKIRQGLQSRWMTNKVQPSVEQLYDIAKHLDVDVRDLLVSTK